MWLEAWSASQGQREDGGEGGHKYIVVVIVFDCANSPLIIQMFTKHKFLIEFCIGTRGQVQAISEVKCQLMSSMATIFLDIP